MPNLILIDCHDLGRHLGSYGWRTVPSPHLDTLATSGIRFSNSFCTAPQCSPSRAALYTGRYPHANGMLGLAHDPFNWRLHADERHLARYLQEAGYATAQIGFQHLTKHEEQAVYGLGFQQVWQENHSDEIATRVVAFLSDPPKQPFYLSVGFLDVHRDEQGQYQQAPPDSNLGVEVPTYLPQTPEAQQEFAELQGVIRQLDTAIGRIWKALHDTRLIRDTWLIFTTDHGLAMPRAKCTLYDPGIETALIMVAEPFGLVGGRVISELVSNVDLTPTILEMLGVPIPSKLHGYSFANRLQDLPYNAREQIFAEKTFHTAYEPMRAVRTEKYKLIWNAETGILNIPGDVMQSATYPQMISQTIIERPPLELYDLQQDPWEQENLIQNPDYTGISHNLSQRLLNWMQKTNDPLLEGAITSPFYHQGLGWLQTG